MEKMLKTIFCAIMTIIALCFGACDDSGSKGGAGDIPVLGPEAPGAARVTPADSQLSLEWDSIEDAIAYEVWYSETNDSGTAIQHGGDIMATNAVITELDNGSQYFIWLKAKHGIGTSGFGEVASGTPDFDPAAVSGLTAVTAPDNVTLSWNDPVSFTLDHIEITWTPGGPADPVTVGPGEQACDIPHAADGTARTFTVTSVFDEDTAFDVTINTTGVIEIRTAVELDNIRNGLAAHYILMADIDLNVTPYNTGEGWLPIGWFNFGATPVMFTGKFDGNGYIVSNLMVFRNGSYYNGLFCYLGSSGSVTDLRLENVSVSGFNQIGALAARNYGVVNDCSVSGTVVGTDNTVGGLIGTNSGTVSECYADVTVSGADNTGGLTGYNNGTMSECYASGGVSGANFTGGLIGYSTGNVSDSYASVGVSGVNYTGGLIGYSRYNTVTCCYATGVVAGPEYSYTGGLIGETYDAICTKSYYDSETTGQSDIGKGAPCTTAQMKLTDTSVTTYTGWDFTGETTNGTEDIWSISGSVNSGYPYLTDNH